MPVSQPNKRHIKTRLITINLLTTATALVLVLLVMLGYEYFAARSELLQRLEVEASIIEENSAPALIFTDTRAAEEVLASLRASPGLVQAALLLPDGSFFAGYLASPGIPASGESSLAKPSSVKPRPVKPSSAKQTPVQAAYHYSVKGKGTHFGLGSLTLYRDIMLYDKHLGTLFIEAKLDRFYDSMQFFAIVITMAVLAALILSFFLLNRLSRAIVLPLSRLAELTRQVSHAKDYAVRTDINSSDEIGDLARGFNNMLGQIQYRDVELQAELLQRRQGEQREQHRNQVLQMLTTEIQLASVLEAIARDIEAINPDIMCSISLLDDTGKYLRHGAAPSLPDFYNQAIDNVAIGLGVGSCGTAAFTGERVIVEDIETHPWWAPYLDLARQAGLGSCWSQPIISTQGHVLGTFAIYHRYPRFPSPADIQLIEDEARLAAVAIEKTTDEARLQLAASVFTHAREGILITDADGTIIKVNDTFTHITGYTREEAIGRNPSMLRSGQQGPEFYAAMWRDLLSMGHWSGELWNLRKNGELYAEILTISAVRDSTGKTQNYVALFTDITPMKQHQQQLEHIAHYDVLTGLPNRVLLADRLQQAMNQSQRRHHSLAVAYLDLDGFKVVNDIHGHDVGDELLVTLAQRMKYALRDGDTLARIGGDEFVAVLVDLEQAQDCEPVLVRLLQAAADPVLVEETVVQVSASVGVTIYPQDGVDADQLMRHADQAMYVAKLAGKNRYHLFDVVQDTAVKTQRESLERIRHALDQREFVLYYQPKVNMKTGAVVGAEALIRWQHPERGLLPPAAFLPVIEDHSLSIEVGEWVIDTALTQIMEWNVVGLDIPISVNIGAMQLQQQNFVPRFLELLAVHPDVHPGRLELEILETSAMEDISQVSKVMHACHEVGVRFALDDFGTGYSSLTYLKRLPADVLKIDRSFVHDMIDDPDDLAIVEGVVGLAKAFRREVIAEGVETVMHGKLLIPLGCELAQGYGIARPMPANEFPQWAANWRPDEAWTALCERAANQDDLALHN